MSEYLDRAKGDGFDPLSPRTVYHAFSKLAEKGFLKVESELNKREKFFLDKGDRTRIIEAAKQMDWTEILL